jgi:hypothetical protein
MNVLNPSAKKPPGTVVAIGTLWLIVAGTMLALGLALLVLFGVIDNFVPGGLDDFPKPPPEALPLFWMFMHYWIAGFLTSALGLLGVYSGIHFLRLKPWARTALEAAGWSAVALGLFGGLWLSQFWTAAPLESGDSYGPNGRIAIRLITGLLTSAYYVVFPVAFTWILRSRTMRQAFAAEGEGDIPTPR